MRDADRFCSSCGWVAGGATPAGSVTPIATNDAAAEIWKGQRERLRDATRGRYEIIRQIGEGGMAAIFLAHQPSLKRDVAIKVMAPGLLTTSGMIERFLAEAQTIAQFRCQHIVQILEVEQAAGDLYFFVMEYIRGSSLDRVLREHGPLPLAVVRAMLYEAGQGLAYAHRHGVIHRDVKPSNIMLDSEGLSILTDFGIAKQSDVDGVTRSGARVGTPAYMSPEQCNSSPLTWASDQYSLGVVAYELLAGRPPFEGKSFEIEAAHVSRAPPPISLAGVVCPAEVAMAIERMLAKRPDQRWPSMSAALQAIGCKALHDGDPLRGSLARLAQQSMTLNALSSGAPGLVGVPTTVDRLTLQSSPRLLHPGDVAQLEARALGRDGRHLPDRVIVWSSSDSTVLGMDSSGSLVAKAPGTSTVTARCEGKSVAADVVVTQSDEMASAAQSGAARWMPTALLAFSVVGSLILAAPMMRSAGLRSTDASSVGLGSGMGASEETNNGETSPTADAVARDSASALRSTRELLPPARDPRSATAVTSDAVVISRIIVDSPQPLQELMVGESIVLSAHAMAASGARAPASITWSISDSTVARLQGSSVLAARAPGRVRVRASIATAGIEKEHLVVIVAPPAVATPSVGASDSLPPVGGRTAEVTARVPAAAQESKLPQREDIPMPPADVRAEPMLRAAMAKHAAMLQQADISGIQGVYPSENAIDRANLSKLTVILKTREYRTQVDAEAGMVGAPVITASQATWSYSIRIRWRNNFGANMSEIVKFDVRFERTDNVWRITSARMIGNPKIG